MKRISLLFFGLSMCTVAGAPARFASAWAALAVPSQSAAKTAVPKHPAAAAEKLDRPGLPNLGKVSATLYRGGQPEGPGFVELRTLGVEAVVNFRDEKDHIETERKQVESLGMRYVSIPWNAFHGPENQQVAEFFDFLRANPNVKTFAHCHHGADRTGVMIAAWRISAQGWSPEEAITEMRQFHYHGFWLRKLKKYIREFPNAMKNDPHLRAAPMKE